MLTESGSVKHLLDAVEPICVGRPFLGGRRRCHRQDQCYRDDSRKVAWWLLSQDDILPEIRPLVCDRSFPHGFSNLRKLHAKRIAAVAAYLPPKKGP